MMQPDPGRLPRRAGRVWTESAGRRRTHAPSKDSNPLRAAYIEQTGPPEVIQVGELPQPRPGPGQVRVRVAAAALNPIDLYIRSGLVAMPLSFPYVIACDLAGTVEQVGPQCTGLRVGDRVWGSNQGMFGRQGVASEYAVVDQEWLYPTHAQLPDTEAA